MNGWEFEIKQSECKYKINTIVVVTETEEEAREIISKQDISHYLKNSVEEIENDVDIDCYEGFSVRKNCEDWFNNTEGEYGKKIFSVKQLEDYADTLSDESEEKN